MKTVIKLIATGMGLGYSPVAPGTAGSILGVLIFLSLRNHSLTYLFVSIFLIAVGFIVCPRAEEIFRQKDSRLIVIDEIAGMCIVYFCVPAKLWIIITGFIVYRIFDIIKLPPAKKIDGLHGPGSVMLDDIVVAVYTNIILQVLLAGSASWPRIFATLRQLLNIGS